MKTYIKQPQPVSHTIQSKTKAANQAPLSKILQACKDKTAQRETFEEDEELLQGKFEVSQREKIDDEELLQSKFESTQRKEAQIPPSGGVGAGNLPANLKSGIENLSGYSMDDVRVHYNSDKPAQLQALAYTQGTDIHIAPGQEKHLSHEAWHVVQQKQGRVQPTMQLQGVNVNDNEGLEKEADRMGGEAGRIHKTFINHIHSKGISKNTKQIQLKGKKKRKRKNKKINQLEGILGRGGTTKSGLVLVYGTEDARMHQRGHDTIPFSENNVNKFPSKEPTSVM